MIFYSYCLDKTSIIQRLKHQLLSLTIDISTPRTRHSSDVANEIIFNRIFTMFPNLQYLNFGRSSMWDDVLSFCSTRPTVISTNLLELHVCLDSFYDCLYLLDGHFTQLRSLYVDVKLIGTLDRRINNKVNCFIHQYLIQLN
jgi:hypothetical protein